MRAISALNNAFDEITQNRNMNSKPLLESNEELVNYLVTEPDPLIETKNIRTRAGYLLDHSINVAMLSILTAKALDYSVEQLRVIGIGTMLHDNWLRHTWSQGCLFRASQSRL
jgi:HD-GYP domain-containing protein (c-di-GMP phosphodiesterase class II)